MENNRNLPAKTSILSGLHTVNNLSKGILGKHCCKKLWHHL